MSEKRPFTSEDDLAILEMRAAGATYVAIGIEIDRNEGSVKSRHVILKKTTWHPLRDIKLRELIAKGYSFGAAGAELGVTKNAAIGRGRRLGLVAHPDNVAKVVNLFGQNREGRLGVKPHWTDEDVTKVRECADAGFSRWRTCRVLNLTEVTLRRIIEQNDIQFQAQKTNGFIHRPMIADLAAYTPIVVGPARTCQYVTGKEGRETFFCGDASVPGHSWCDAHCSRVFVRHQLAAEETCAA